MLKHVELVAPPSLTLRVVHIERTIANDAREGDAMIGSKIETVAAGSLPSETATRTKAADVAAEKQLVSRGHRVANPCSNQRVEPIHGG